MEGQKEKVYQKKWFAILMLIFFAPVGIYLLWTNEHFEKRTNIILTVLFSLFFIVVIFSESDTEENLTQDDETEEIEETNEELLTAVELTLDAEINDDIVDFEGETNLPDGAIITYEVWHEEDIEKFAEGNLEVEDGLYSEEVSVKEWPAGEIGVWVSFQTVLGTSTYQPDEIIEVFGEMGENIEGDNISESDTMKLVELKTLLMKEPVIVQEEPDEVTNEKQEEIVQSEPEKTETDKREEDTKVDVAETKTEESTKADTTETEIKESTKADTTETKKVDQETTLSQQNAVDMAGNYLSYTAFSKIGLIEQLEFEGFDNADAVFGVNAIDVNWRDQAKIMAENYISYSAFSENGLIEQLIFEGFDHADAVYGANAIEVDWQEQAIIMAEDYLNYSTFSRSGLIDQLKFEGFSDDHATNAVDEIGL